MRAHWEGTTGPARGQGGSDLPGEFCGAGGWRGLLAPPSGVLGIVGDKKRSCAPRNRACFSCAPQGQLLWGGVGGGGRVPEETDPCRGEDRVWAFNSPTPTPGTSSRAETECY